MNEQPVKGLPTHLLQILADRLAVATNFDEMHAIPAAQKLVEVEINPEVRGLYNDLRRVAHGIVADAHDEKIPGIYISVSRLAPIALRIVGTLAVMDSPYAPSITGEQLRWSFGYLLQNLISLLSDMDKGEIGDKANEEFVVVTKTIIRLMKKPEYREMGGVPTTRLKEEMKQRKPFKGHPRGAYKHAGEALTAMKDDGLIATHAVQNLKGGPVADVYFLTPEGLWR